MKKKGVIFLAYLPAAVLFVSVVLVYTGDHRLLTDAKSAHSFRFIFPQGWAFFTKNPDEHMIDLYKLRDHGKIEKINFRNNSTNNLFGLKRDARFVYAQISRLEYQLSDSECWLDANPHQKKGLLQQFFDSSTLMACTTLHLDSTYFYFESNTTYLLTRNKTIPIEWYWGNQEQFNPLQYNLFEVEFEQ